MTLSTEIINKVRRQFPALSRQVSGKPAVYFDGPGGTQVPQRVIEAVSHYLAHTNANMCGYFATTRETDTVIDEAHRALADFVGTQDPQTIVFGLNMTSLTFAMSRALAKTWQSGDEVIVTRLDHDANVSPWVLAARDAGVTVRFVEMNKEDCTLDMDDFRAKLSPRTKLVAIGAASNSVGTLNPVREICDLARGGGALTYVDAVHYAPHALIDVESLGCDFLACSAYKFFGPHVGVLWGRRELLDELPAYKVRPAPTDLPGKWMTGTQCHEGIAGAAAAVEYLARLGRDIAANDSLDRRAALREAFAAISAYERELVSRLLSGLAKIDSIRVWGIADPQRLNERLPTVSITHDKMKPAKMAERLGERGIFVWHGNYYALELSEALGREPDGMLRIGLVHYNTEAEVDRLLTELAAV